MKPGENSFRLGGEKATCKKILGDFSEFKKSTILKWNFYGVQIVASTQTQLFTSWIASNLVWHLHRWFLPKTTENLLIVEYLQGGAHGFWHWQLPSLKLTAKVKPPGNGWLEFSIPFLLGNPYVSGENCFVLGRATKWWCYFLASQAGGEKGKAQSRHPKNDVFVQNIPPKQHPRSDWNSLDSNVFCLLRILVILFVYCNRFIERSNIEASTITMEMIIWASEARKPEKTSPFTSKKSFDPPPLPSHKLSSGSVFLTHLWCFRFSGHHSIFFSVDVK